MTMNQVDNYLPDNIAFFLKLLVYAEEFAIEHTLKYESKGVHFFTKNPSKIQEDFLSWPKDMQMLFKLTYG